MNEDAPPKASAQEEDNIPSRRVFAGFAAVLAMMAALIAIALLLVRAGEADLRPSGDFPEGRLGPRRAVRGVQQDLFGDAPGFGQRLDEEKRRALSTYGWVDKERRIIHLPIEEAMDVVAEQENRR